MDPAAAAGARAIRMSPLWAGGSSWRTWAGATPRNGTDDYATAGSGPTRQSGARDSELPRASRRGACKVIALTNRCSFLSEAGRVTVRGRRSEWTNVSQLASALLRINSR
jgi:hypothetical protein